MVVERQGADARREQHPAQVVLLRPRHLPHCRVGVVDRDDGDPCVATRVPRAEVGQPAVVGPRADGLQFPIGALGAGTARRVERRGVVLCSVREDHVGDDAVCLQLRDAPIGVVRAGSATRRRSLGVVLFGHELRIEELRQRLVELPTLRFGVLAELLEVGRIHVFREASLRVGGSAVAVR